MNKDTEIIAGFLFFFLWYFSGEEFATNSFYGHCSWPFTWRVLMVSVFYCKLQYYVPNTIRYTNGTLLFLTGEDDIARFDPGDTHTQYIIHEAS